MKKFSFGVKKEVEVKEDVDKDIQFKEKVVEEVKVEPVVKEIVSEPIIEKEIVEEIESTPAPKLKGRELNRELRGKTVQKIHARGRK